MPIGADFLRDGLLPEPMSDDSGEISLPGDMIKAEDLPDGSSIYEIMGEPEEAPDDKHNFNANLAEIIPDNVLDGIAAKLLENIENDLESRREWENGYNLGLKYLGIKVEEFRDYPFAHASSVYDATLMSALLRFWSTARAELFPPQGPSRSQIMGPDTDEIEHLASEVVKFLNHYLTIMDREYYPDSDRMLWYLGLVGSAVRKIYKDPLTGQPKARFIDPQDFIVNSHCKNILSADRLTQTTHLTRKEIKLRQNVGYYSDEMVPSTQDDFDTESVTKKNINRIEGIDTASTENTSVFVAYESHADLMLDDMNWKDPFAPKDLPVPYIVTVLKQTRKILSIYRNWEENDTEFKRKQCFILYNYLPGFGIYGVGLAQLLGSSAIGATSIKRQLIDAGMLKNFPGGLKMRGLRVENNDKAIGPSEFWDVETGGLPIRDAIMLMPYNEPSVVLKDLLNDLIGQMQQISNTAETQIADMNSETPVGTTLAMLEVANRVQSSILRTLHMSLSYELDLIYNFFKDNLDENQPFEFSHPGGTSLIEKQHFNELIRIIPTSDPNLTSSTQRILRAEAILRLAQSAPELHDMKNAYYRMYQAMNVDNIEKLLPPEEQVQPMDPVTENMNAINGKPVKASVEQDHEAHIMVHQLTDVQNLPNMAAHIQEHIAFKMLVDIQIAMGMEMPAPEMLQNPQVQNQIAIAAAQAAQMMKKQHEESQGPSPQAVMVMDVEQRREAAQLKHKESDTRAQTEAFKANLKYDADLKKLKADHEAELAKIQAQIDIARERNELDLELADIKQSKQRET